MKRLNGMGLPIITGVVALWSFLGANQPVCRHQCSVLTQAGELSRQVSGSRTGSDGAWRVTGTATGAFLLVGLAAGQAKKKGGK